MDRARKRKPGSRGAVSTHESGLPGPYVADCFYAPATQAGTYFLCPHFIRFQNETYTKSEVSRPSIRVLTVKSGLKRSGSYANYQSQFNHLKFVLQILELLLFILVAAQDSKDFICLWNHFYIDRIRHKPPSRNLNRICEGEGDPN